MLKIIIQETCPNNYTCSVIVNFCTKGIYSVVRQWTPVEQIGLLGDEKTVNKAKTSTLTRI